MPIEAVFLDMDGVLANFMEAALRAHGLDPQTLVWPPGAVSYASVMGIEKSHFWPPIDGTSGFWERLEPYPWIDDLLRACRQVTENIALLSTPSPAPGAWSGKRTWQRRHLPDCELILCRSKHFLATPSRVLIDDTDEKIDKWRAAGGHGIVFPQLWNSAHPDAHRPIEAVSGALTLLVGG